MDWKFRLRLKDLEKERQQKTYARTAVYNAVKHGKLKKETCRCGASEVEAHHIDYSKPLHVIWVCKKHHRELDKLREELQAFSYLTPSYNDAPLQ
jgi:hypothetical protein